jgi:glycosyltransferase involved in cell wall biosynthesis
MARRLRVLFVIAQFDTGGVQHQVWLRLRHLDPATYECCVAVLTGGNSHLLDRVRALGVRVDFLRVDEERSLWGRVARIQDHIGSVQPDVVDTLLGWDNTYGAMAAVLARVPLVVSELQTMGVMRTGYSRSFLVLEALAHRYFNDHVVCCSGAVRAKYSRSLPGFHARSSVIFDAVETDYPHPDRDAARRQFGVPDGRVVLGTLGRLHEVKDHDTLLRATRRLVDRRPDVLVVVGGAGALRESLLAQREHLGLGDHVRFVGEVTEVHAFHAAIDVVVLT